MKRSDSLPARLPSDPPRRTEVKPIRHPITRPTPDAKPPVNFHAEEGVREGSLKKTQALENRTDTYEHFAAIVEGDREFMEIIESRHPNYARYPSDRKFAAMKAVEGHPRFIAEVVKLRNEIHSIPSAATSTRMMKPDEQRFLTHAFRELKAEFQKKRRQHRIHGETALVEDKKGWITEFNYSAKSDSSVSIYRGDKYHLHTHPPLHEPLTSSASEGDHRIAAEHYRMKNNEMMTYVTNGKDVLHIPPDSTELVKLLPDPAVEKQMGKFPVAYTLPDPKIPLHPFSNHEAPAAFKSKPKPPRGNFWI